MTESGRDFEKARRLLRERLADVPEGRLLSEELIAERREEAAREDREFAALGSLDAGDLRRRLKEPRTIASSRRREDRS